MRGKIIGKCMKIIKESNLNYSEEKLEEIQYGLEGLYILITKSIIIFGIAFLLGVAKPLFIFLLIYNIIRMPSFGLHASKSWICLVSSFVIFMVSMYLSLTVNFSLYIRIAIGIYCIIRVYQNAPADTHKRPIINQKRRDTYKFISTIISIVFVFLTIFIQDMFLRNAFIGALCVQTAMISPLVYKLFNVPYDNYKAYIINNGLN